MFSGDRPKDYSFVTEAADKNENIRTPAAANVTDEMRRIIPLTPEWTFWPDYERVRGAAGLQYSRVAGLLGRGGAGHAGLQQGC